MATYPALAYLRPFQRVLIEDEIIEYAARQRRIGPGGSIFAPGIVVATDRRIIVIRDVLQLHLREDIDVIPYSTITYIRLQHGVISCSIVIGILGFTGAREMDPSSSTSMMQIHGLRYKDAMILVKTVEKRLARAAERRRVEERVEPKETRELVVKAEWEATCTNCGAKNPASAKYCTACGARL